MPPSTCRKRLTDSTSQLEDHAPSNNSNGKVYHAVPVDVTPHHTVVTVVPDAPRPEPKDPVSVGQVVLDHLNLVEEYVEKTVPNSCWPGLGFDLDPVKIPSIERLREYALNLDNVANPACSRQMFDQLLGRAGQVDVEYPLPTFLAPLAPYFPGRPVVTSLTFPQDHHFHPTWGDEWYYVCAKVPILDADGNFGEAAFLSSIQRKRAIGLTTQQKYGWTDAQSTILSNVCTVTVRFKDFWGNVTRTVYARGSLNTHWGAVEPNVSSFSAPGQPFGISAGSGDNVASFTSTQPSTSPEILPATFSVNNKVDGKVNIKTDLTFSSAAGVDPNQGWFLQGTPSLTTSASPIGAPGDGLTLPPAAGLYYSWPQTVVTGTTLVVNDETFVIVGPGNGWVDHQSLSNTLFNFDLVNATTNPFPIQPIPFRQDAGPVNGWTWNFCNFEDGTSWTGAVFEEAPPVLASPTLVPYGYSVTLGSDGKYVGAYTVGTAVLNPATRVTAPAGRPITTEATPFVSQFQVANERQFMEQGNSTLITTATGWTDPYGNTLRCDFNNADFTGVAEAPADWIQPTKLFNNRGWGFLETVSFERKYACQIRMMHYLDNSTYPEEGPLVEEVRKRSVVKNCCGCFTRLLYRIYRCLSFSRPDHEARSALL